MGRRKKQGDIEEAIAKQETRTNGFNRKMVKGYVDRLENLHGDIRKIMMDALSECKAVHADIKEVLQEAKDEAGIPKKELKRVIKARALERKAAAVREELESEEQDNYDMIRMALGDLADTPLGQAATAPFTAPDTSAQPFAAPPA